MSHDVFLCSRAAALAVLAALAHLLSQLSRGGSRCNRGACPKKEGGERKNRRKKEREIKIKSQQERETSDNFVHPSTTKAAGPPTNVDETNSGTGTRPFSRCHGSRFQTFVSGRGSSVVASYRKTRQGGSRDEWKHNWQEKRRKKRDSGRTNQFMETVAG